MKAKECKECSYYGKQYKICEYNDCKPLEDISNCPIPEADAIPEEDR